MGDIDVKAGEMVLWLWAGQSPSDDLQSVVKDLQQRLGNGKIQMEHVDRLTLGMFICFGLITVKFRQKDHLKV